MVEKLLSIELAKSYRHIIEGITGLKTLEPRYYSDNSFDIPVTGVVLIERREPTEEQRIRGGRKPIKAGAGLHFSPSGAVTLYGTRSNLLKVFTSTHRKKFRNLYLQGEITKEQLDSAYRKMPSRGEKGIWIFEELEAKHD